MPVTMESLGIDRLSIEDRLALVNEIWDSITAQSPPQELSTAVREELDRRVAEDDANPQAAIPWEEARDATLARLRSQ